MGSLALAVLAAVLAVVGVSATARGDSPVFIQISMGMADPGSYNHATGGGHWGDGFGVSPGDIDNEFQWANYRCGDIVSFLLLVSEDTTAGLSEAPRTVDVDLAFDAASSGDPGAGYSDIVRAVINPNDAAQVGDGGSTVTLTKEQLTGLYTPGGLLTGTIRVNDLEPGESVVVRVDVRLSCKLDVGRSGLLYAQVPHTPDGQTGAREVSPQPRDLGVGQLRQQIIQINDSTGAYRYTVTKTPDKSQIPAPGGPVTFTVTITNNEPSGGVFVEKLVDDVFGDISTVHGNITATTCTLPRTVQAGLPSSCTFTANVTGNVGDVHHDTVLAEGGGARSDGSATVNLIGRPGLDVAKELASNADQDGSGTITEGDTLTFSITVTNTGNLALTGVTVSDALVGVGPLSCPTLSGSLALGASATCTATYTVTAADVTAGEIVNTGRATSDQTGPNTDTLRLVTAERSQLTVTVTVSPSGPAKAGDVLTVTEKVANTGGTPLTSVTLKDPKLAVNESVGAMAIGEERTFTRTYTVTAADVTAGRIDFDPVGTSAEAANATDHTSVVVVPTPLLTITNVPDRTEGTVGQVVTFTVTVTNAGDSQLTNVVVADADLGIAETIASLAPGAARVFTGRITLTTTHAAAGKLVNTASASSEQTTAVTASATVSARVATVVLDLPPIRALPITGAGNERALWLSLSLLSAGAAYLVAGRRPRRLLSRS